MTTLYSATNAILSKVNIYIERLSGFVTDILTRRIAFCHWMFFKIKNNYYQQTETKWLIPVTQNVLLEWPVQHHGQLDTSHFGQPCQRILLAPTLPSHCLQNRWHRHNMVSIITIITASLMEDIIYHGGWIWGHIAYKT